MSGFKLKFCVNSGANIHSEKSHVVDMVDYLGSDSEEARKEWEQMDEDEKNKMVEEWAWNNGLEIYFREA